MGLLGGVMANVAVLFFFLHLPAHSVDTDMDSALLLFLHWPHLASVSFIQAGEAQQSHL